MTTPRDAFEASVTQNIRTLTSMLDDAPHFNVGGAVRLMERRSPIIVTGMGKSGHVGLKAASTFRSLGFPAHFLHPGEASHGDLGMIVDNSVVLAISNSGETKELGDILAYCKERGTAVIAITSKASSTLADVATATFVTGKIKESCPNGLAPTTSTVVAMVICDALAVALACTKGVTAEDFHRFHPGGSLGARLKPVTEVMKPLPKVDPLNPMKVVAPKMTHGAAVVIGPAGMQGIITDGDIRRKFPRPGDLAKTVMTPNPLMIDEKAPVAEAILKMNDVRVTSLIVIDIFDDPIGIVHLQDCLAFSK